MYELIWNKNNNLYTSNIISNFHYTITHDNNLYTMQEFYKNSHTPEFATIENLEFAQYLAQTLADNILIID